MLCYAGALPWVIPALDPKTPVYAGSFVMQLVARRLQEYNLYNPERWVEGVVVETHLNASHNTCCLLWKLGLFEAVNQLVGGKCGLSLQQCAMWTHRRYNVQLSPCLSVCLCLSLCALIYVCAPSGSRSLICCLTTRWVPSQSHPCASHTAYRTAAASS